MRSQTFLELFRVLEGLLEKKYDGVSRKSSSVVMEYLSDPESEPIRQELNLCREIRNLLTHNADASGGAVVEPSKAVLESLMAAIDYVQSPKPALTRATPASQALTARLGDAAIDIMRSMQEHGYSHVPVLKNGCLVGVFSMRSVFSYVLKKGASALDSRTRITDFGRLISLDRSEGERFLVLPASASVLEVQDQFNRGTARNSRLAVVFFTEHGLVEEPLLGLITPWDVLSAK